MENQIPPISDQPSIVPVQSSLDNHQELQKYAELLEHASALLIQVRDGLRRMGEFVHTTPTSNVVASSYVSAVSSAPTMVAPNVDSSNDRVVEGVFNGYSMIGDDEKTYQIPPNYASKSKLVEGDRLKLVIQLNGQFVYKQIGPVERERRVGKLERTTVDNGFAVVTPERTYRVLMASITYYHGGIGDEVVLLVPRGGNCIWAAVENIMRTPSGHSTMEQSYSSFISSSMPVNTPTTPPPTHTSTSSPSMDSMEDDLASIMSDFRPRTE